MAPTSAYRLSVIAALALGCRSGPSTIVVSEPREAPGVADLPLERIRRGVAASSSQAPDTDQPEGRVRAAVLRHREALRACFERVLPASPEAEGRLTLSFVVETSGAVFDAAADTSTPALRPVRECVLALVRPLTIDGLRHPLRVTFPLQFDNPPLELDVPEIALYPRMRVTPPESVAALVHAGSGDLTVDEVAAVLGLRLNDHLQCYLPSLRERPTRRAEGAAHFTMAVNSDGSVGDVTLGGLDDGVRATGECHLNLLRTARFRPTGRRSTLALTFAMRPQETPSSPLAPRR